MERNSDTGDFFRRELSTLAQYSALALLAVVSPFVMVAVLWTYFPSECHASRPGETCGSYHWIEIWENERPLIFIQLLAFAVLVSIRLLAVFAAKRRAAFK